MKKRSVSLNDKCEGRLKKSNGKGKRLAISAMINEAGFHKESVDIFTCDEEHSMNSIHFTEWVEKAASYLRFLHGSIPRIGVPEFRQLALSPIGRSPLAKVHCAFASGECFMNSQQFHCKLGID